ncbi:unnamed protein product [Durusdinium trenchii]|uniref:Uncharacterized protein n=1 Tax=Durusdinium trenchii TaxID=1381693 RepID=A0ABP0M5G0_9DINO
MAQWARHGRAMGRTSALRNWVGVTQAPCNSPNRICSSKLDTHGTMSALEHHLKRWRLSSNVQNLAEDFLVRHPELGWTYNAVQLRAEMVLNYRYLSPTCNDTGVYQWFQTLRSQISTWNGTWFRAKDLKKGGSRTLKRYDNESMQRLVELERDLWRDSPVTFIENECEGLPDVMCLLVDVALLSRAERLYLWGSSGGVDLWCRIERERLNLPSRHVFRSMLAPQGC